MGKLRHFWWELHGRSTLKAIVESDVVLRTTMFERLAVYPGAAPSCVERAAQALQFAEDRASLPQNALRRILKVLRLASSGQYRKFSYVPWSIALRDVLNR